MGIQEFLIDRARKEGELEAALERRIFFTTNLLTQTDTSVSKIARLVGVSKYFVLKVNKGLPSQEISSSVDI